MSNPRRNWLVAALLAAGALLRLVLIAVPRTWDDDSGVYRELGMNLFHAGTYGIEDSGTIYPSLFRLPGYPIFLALHNGHFVAAQITQTILDLLMCWLLYRFMLRVRGQRAALWTLALSSLCIFTAAYAATPLAESLSVTCVGTAIYALDRQVSGRGATWLLALACGIAMTLRPDGALLTFSVLVALLVYGAKQWGFKAALQRVVLVGLCSVVLLVPWTVRNWRTFHVFQPLAPRHVNDPGERVNLGFYRWIRSFSADTVTTGDVFWKVGTEPITMDDLPARAIEDEAERVRTAAILDEYNKTHSVDAALDAKFESLAADRIHRHPLRYYVTLPLMRAADMWLRPRTEAFNADPYWWHWREHPGNSAKSVVLGSIGLFYVGMALFGLLRRPPLMVFCISYVLLRTLLVATMENPETRYTLEAFPVLFVSAATFLASLVTPSEAHPIGETPEERKQYLPS